MPDPGLSKAMIEQAEEHVRHYLRPAADAFWQWAEDGEVAVWNTGETIAFRHELAFVLGRLAPRGLPAFEMVLLLLAATRDRWREFSAAGGPLLDISQRLIESGHGAATLNQVLAGLDWVSYLEPQLRSPLDAKAVLVETVLQSCPKQVSPPESIGVVQRLRDGLDETIFAATDSPPPRRWTDLAQQLVALRDGLRRLDPETLELRRRTGLDETVLPAEVETPVRELTWALLRELESDDELRGLSRVARDLAAVVALPRPLAEPDDLAAGGVSDIANRGPLDRLLLSELAHDDLTLAVRVAVNEAMYLRRESPPKSPARVQVIAIDAGIRMWGLPRVFATAAALALSASADVHTNVAVLVPNGRDILPATLTHRDGLIAHLETLRPDPTPARSLAALAAWLHEQDRTLELVLLTADEAWDDDELQAALRSAPLGEFHVGLVNRHGRFRLLQRGPRGTKQLRQAWLDLDKLLPRQPAGGIVDPPGPRDLPAICHANPFPLLLSQPLDRQRCLPIRGQGWLSLTSDGRLLLWRDRMHGGKLLMTDAPAGEFVWRSRVDHDHLVAIVYVPKTQTHEALVVDFATPQAQRMPLEVGDRHLQFGQYAGYTLFISPENVCAMRLYDGVRMRSAAIPTHLAWVHDRFFRHRSRPEWWALVVSGNSLQFELVLNEHSPLAADALRLFERSGHEGPFCITHRGELHSLTADTIARPTIRNALSNELNFVPTAERVTLSYDGNMVTFSEWNSTSGRTASRLLDLETMSLSQAVGAPRQLVEQRDPLPRAVPLRRRIVAAAVSEGNICLATPRAKVVLELNPRSKQLILEERKLAAVQFTAFEPLPAATDGFTLQVARRGSEFILDSRGMLHLRAPGTRLPEVTLVLCDGRVAGWCSDGRTFGRDYFLEHKPTIRDEQAYHELIRPLLDRW